jgi:hypothetical protein
MQPFLIIGSLGALAFGILAQVTEFRERNGHIKGKAKWILVGIGASALLSLIGGVLSEREGTQASNTRQEDLLRTIWKESNRIEAQDLSVEITSESYDPDVQQLPTLFQDKDEWMLSFAAVRQADANKSLKMNLWSPKHILQKPELFVQASARTTTARHYRSIDSVTMWQISEFSHFAGQTGSLVDPLFWNGAFVEAHLTAMRPAFLEELRSRPIRAPSVDTPLTQEDSLKRSRKRIVDSLSEYDVPDRYLPGGDSDAVLRPLPYRVTLTLYIKNHPVIKSEARLAGIQEWDEDVRGLVVAKFPVVTIPERTFPDFQPTPSPKKTQSSWLDAVGQAMGWLIVAFVIGAAIVVTKSERRAA